MKNILCFGDSNTWGYNPVNGERFSKDIRWTSRLQNRLDSEQINVVEEGLCGRTTVYEDQTRPNRKGIDSIVPAFSKNKDIDTVILMLGTNDCKTYYDNSAEEIANGVDRCLDRILEYVNPEDVLLISPIRLGDEVWRDEYDPEFNSESVNVSKHLKQEYLKVARKKKVHFIAASDYVSPSVTDQEHMDPEGHRVLADVIYDKIIGMNRKCA